MGYGEPLTGSPTVQEVGLQMELGGRELTSFVLEGVPGVDSEVWLAETLVGQVS